MSICAHDIANRNTMLLSLPTKSATSTVIITLVLDHVVDALRRLAKDLRYCTDSLREFLPHYTAGRPAHSDVCTMLPPRLTTCNVLLLLT